MRVPNSPRTMRKVVTASSGKSEDEHSDLSTTPFSSPIQTRKPPQDPILTARLKEAIAAEKENMLPTPATPPIKDLWTADGLPNMGFHKSRDRTRRPAVLRLVERKQAQKEKERERDRKARAKSSETIRTSNIVQPMSSLGLSSTSFTSRFASCETTSNGPSTSSCVSSNEHISEKHRRFSSNDVPNLANLTTERAGAVRRSASSSRHKSQERSEILTKTYIRIGPGKPAQIREHSPSKIPPSGRKPSLPEEDESDIASFAARLQREKSTSSSPTYSRASSPSKKSDLLFNFDHKPLKSTSLLKDISNKDKSEAGQSEPRQRKRSYITEKTINLGPPERPRRSASEHNFQSNCFAGAPSPVSASASASASPPSSTIHESKSWSADSSPRYSSDRDFHPNSPCSSPATSTSSSSKATTASFSSFSSSSGKFGGSSESVSSNSSTDSHLSQRRKSLERRFQTRSSRLSSSPERRPVPEDPPGAASPASSASSGFSSASSRLLYNLSSGYRYHRAAVSASASNRPRRFSQDHSSDSSTSSSKPTRSNGHGKSGGNKEPSRKISLPPTCYEDPERSIASAKRFVLFENMYGDGLGGGIHSSSNSLRKYLSSPCSSHTSYTSVQSSPSCFPHFPSPELISPQNTIKMSQQRSFVRSGDSGLAGMDFQLKSEKSPTHLSGVQKSIDVSNVPKTSSSSDSDIFSTLSPVSNGEYRDEVISYLQFDKEDDTKTPKVCRRKNLRPKLASTTDSASRSKLQGKHKQIPDKEYCQESTEDRSVSDMQDAQSVSTVSGTGMNFFRKFVQRKKRSADDRKDDKSDSLISSKPPDTDEDRESQARFRREVLIERLVSDALSLRSGTDSSCSSASSTTEEETWNDFLREPLDLEEIQDALSSISSVKTNARSSINLSSVSGSGLKFLRNYLRKKKPIYTKAEPTDRNPAFNGVPVPYPPLDDFYGPAYLSNDEIDVEDKRMSIASTIANLLNESFNSDEDSELENLDWDDWMDQDGSTQLGDLVSLAQNVYHSTESEASASRDDTPTQDVMASTQRTSWSTTFKDDAKKMDTFSKMSNSLPLANALSKKSAQDSSKTDMSFMIVGCPPLADPELEDLDEFNLTKVGHDQHGWLEQGSNGHGGRHDDRGKQGQQYSMGRKDKETGTPQQESLYLLETFDTDKDPPIMASVKRRTRKSEHLKKIDDGARLRNAPTSSLLSASSQNSSHSNNKHLGSPGGNFGTSSSALMDHSRWPSGSSNQSTPNAENSSSSRSTGTSCSTPSPNPQFDCQFQSPDLTSRNRLVSFWNERVSNPSDEMHLSPQTYKRSISDGGCQVMTQSAGFKPVFPSYYKPETHDLATERIQAFVNATRKAANDAQKGEPIPLVDSISSSVETTPNSLEKWEKNRSELKLLKCQSDAKAKDEPYI